MATEVKNKWAYNTEPFGEPTLYASRNSSANWVRTPTASVYLKSPAQWVANLYGGLQTGDDWASIVVPVNEMRIDHLATAMWTYWMTNNESAGVNMVIWLHDPADFSKRVEVTQTMGLVGLTAGWNKENLEMETAELFFYGENTTGTGLSEGTGTYHTWKQFREDTLFKNWVIYRITFDYGWIAASTLDDVWVTEIKINGQSIPLKPDSQGTGRVGHRFKTAASGDPAFTLSPKTPFKLLSFVFHLDSAATQQVLEVKVDAARSSVYDTMLLSQAMSGIRDIVQTWEGGLDLMADDEVDVVWPNADNADYGLTMSYQTVF